MVRVDFQERVADVDARAVDEHVDFAGQFQRFFAQFDKRRFVGNVDRLPNGFDSLGGQFVDRGLAGVRVDVRDDDLRAVFAETGREAKTERAGAADHDRDLAVHSEKIVQIFRVFHNIAFIQKEG